MSRSDYWGISGVQSRMARAAIGLNMRDAACAIGKSHQTVKLFEDGSPKITIGVQHALEELYRKNYCYFGPKHGVCYRGNGFERDLWLGLYQLLKENGISPSSKEMLEASARAREELSK